MIRSRSIAAISGIVVALLGTAKRSRAAAVSADGSAAKLRSIPEPAAIEVDSGIVTGADELLKQVRSGDINRSDLTRELSSMFSSDVVSASKEALADLGSPRSMYPFEQRRNADGMTTLFRVQFESATLTWLVSRDDAGKVSSFALRRGVNDSIVRMLVRNISY